MSTVTVKSYRKEREKEILDGLQKGLEKVGLIVERQAKINVTSPKPSGKSHPSYVDTNRLATSVTHNVGEGYVEIGTNVKYGKYLELGHIQHPGQYVPAIGKRLVAPDVPPYPWLFPAVESNRDKIIDILKSSGAKGVSIE